MAGRFHVNRMVWLGGAALAALLAYAWVDGGAEPVRTLAAPTTLPPVVQ